MYFSVACAGSVLHLGCFGINMGEACARACLRTRVGRQVPRASCCAAAWGLHAATSARQAAGRRRGARDGRGGECAHVSKHGPKHRSVRLLAGRREEGQRGDSRPRGDAHRLFGERTEGKVKPPEAVCRGILSIDTMCIWPVGETRGSRTRSSRDYSCLATYTRG